MKKHLLIYLLAGAAALFFSCEDDDLQAFGEFSGGVFIINEGSFGSGNGSIAAIKGDVVTDKIFEAQNGRNVGDVLQSFATNGSVGYAVVNNDNKVEAINLQNFKSLGAITGLHLPRYINIASSKVGYVSNWGSFDGSLPAYIAKLNLATLAIDDTISLGAFQGSEDLLAVGNILYVANSFSNTLAKVNLSTMKQQTPVVLADAPSDLELSADGKSLWILCSGSYGEDYSTPNDDTPAKLFKYNLSSGSITSSVQIGAKGDHPSKMSVAADGTFAIIVNGNKAIKVTLATLASSTFAEGQDFYGVLVHPTDNLIFLGDSEAFSGEGTAHVYHYNGELLFSKASGGIGPNGFVVAK